MKNKEPGADSKASKEVPAKNNKPSPRDLFKKLKEKLLKGKQTSK